MERHRRKKVRAGRGPARNPPSQQITKTSTSSGMDAKRHEAPLRCITKRFRHLQKKHQAQGRTRGDNARFRPGKTVRKKKYKIQRIIKIKQ